MKKLLAIGIISALVPVLAFAQAAPVPASDTPLGDDAVVQKKQGWVGHKNQIEDTPNRKSLHGFGASLTVIRNESFFSQWEAGKGGTGEVKVPLVKSVPQIAPFWVVVFTTGAGVDGSNCDVTFDVVIKRPDNSELKTYKNLTACKDVKQEPGVIYLSHDKALVELTLDEPAGVYTIDAAVKDNGKGVKLDLYRPVEILVSAPIKKEVMELPLTERKVLVDEAGNPVKELPAGTEVVPAPKAPEAKIPEVKMPELAPMHDADGCTVLEDGKIVCREAKDFVPATTP